MPKSQAAWGWQPRRHPAGRATYGKEANPTITPPEVPQSSSMMTPAEVVASLAELKAAGKSPIRPPGHWRTWPLEPARHWAAGTQAYNEAQAQHTQPVPAAFNYSGLQHVLLVSFRTVYHDYDFHNRVSCYSSCSCSSSIVVLGSRSSRSSSDAASAQASSLCTAERQGHCRATARACATSPRQR